MSIERRNPEIEPSFKWLNLLAKHWDHLTVDAPTPAEREVYRKCAKQLRHRLDWTLNPEDVSE
jgi:hypothetical protein